MSYLDVLENSDRDSIGCCVVTFFYGIGIYRHDDGRMYEIRTTDFTEPCREYDFHFDFINNKYSLRQRISGSLASTGIIGVWEVKRELLYGDVTKILNG